MSSAVLGQGSKRAESRGAYFRRFFFLGLLSSLTLSISAARRSTSSNATWISGLSACSIARPASNSALAVSSSGVTIPFLNEYSLQGHKEVETAAFRVFVVTADKNQDRY